MGDAVYGPHFKTKAGQLGTQGKEALTAPRPAGPARLSARPWNTPEPGNFCIGRPALPEDLLLLQGALEAAL